MFCFAESRSFDTSEGFQGFPVFLVYFGIVFTSFPLQVRRGHFPPSCFIQASSIRGHSLVKPSSAECYCIPSELIKSKIGTLYDLRTCRFDKYTNFTFRLGRQKRLPRFIFSFSKHADDVTILQASTFVCERPASSFFVMFCFPAIFESQHHDPREIRKIAGTGQSLLHKQTREATQQETHPLLYLLGASRKNTPSFSPLRRVKFATQHLKQKLTPPLSSPKRGGVITCG